MQNSNKTVRCKHATLMLLITTTLAACGQNSTELDMVRKACLNGGASQSVCDCAVSRMKAEGVDNSSSNNFASQAKRNIRECMAASYGL